MAGLAGFPLYTPRVLGSTAVMSLPVGASVLTIPITTRENHGLSMYWQAEAGFRYSQPFGYLLRPGPDGVLTDNLSPSPLANLATALSSGDSRPVGISATAVRLQLRHLGVRALVLMPSAQFAAEEEELRGVLGRSPELADGAAVWLSPGG